jgi:hypothetical protein
MVCAAKGAMTLEIFIVSFSDFEEVAVLIV